MSDRTGVEGWFDADLDVAAAVLGLVVAVALLPLRLLASQVYITTLPFVIGGASAVYLLSVRTRATGELPRIGRSLAQLLPGVTFLGLASMVVVASIGGRTLLFHYLTAWVGVAVLVQVLFTRDRHYHAGVLLAQVLLLAYVVRFSALLTTPEYVGIDVWTHVPDWSGAILEAKSLRPIASEKYYASPLFHLLVVAGSELLGVSLRSSLFLTVGAVVPLSALFVYATTRFFVGSRLAMFATVAFALAGDVVEWGIHLIPTSLGLVFFVAILYSLTRVLHADRYRGRDFLLVLAFSVAVILTHQISSFIMLVFVGSALLTGIVFTVGDFASDVRPSIAPVETANLAGLLFFDLGLITFTWSLTPYKGSNFLETILSYFLTTVTSSAGFLDLAGRSGTGGGAATSGPSLLGKLVEYVDAAGILALLLLTIVGSLFLLDRNRRSPAAYTSVLSIVVMLFFVFGFPLFGVRTFVPGRWMAFLVAPMAVVGAIGAGFVLDRTPRSVAVVLLLLLCLGYPAVSAVSSEATLDSPAFDGVQTRYGYTERELAAVETVSEVRTAGGGEGERLGTDHPYYTVFQRAHDYPARVAHVEDGTATQQAFLYREYQRTGGAYLEDYDEVPYRAALRREEVCRGRDVTYDNGDVTLCVAGTGPTGTGDR